MDVLIFVVNLYVTYIIVVVVHELGHYGAARYVGAAIIGVELGNGPKLHEFYYHGELWTLGAIPFRGHVRFFPPPRRIEHALIVIAGPAANFAWAGLIWMVSPWDFTAIACIFVGAINLLPFKGTDGAMLLDIVRKRRYVYPKS